MNDDIELPLEEGKTLIARTAMTLGYEEELGRYLAHSAWWLENRSLPGVKQAIAYMILTRDLAYQDRKRIKVPEGGQRIHSPVWAANLFWKLMDDGMLIEQPVAIYGPVSPLLLAPMITYAAAEIDKAAKMRFYGLDVIFSRNGVWVTNANDDSVNWTSIYLLDADAEDATSVQLVDLNELSLGETRFNYNRLDTLKFPKFRFRGEEPLYLGD